jgi:hypothetical protein
MANGWRYPKIWNCGLARRKNKAGWTNLPRNTRTPFSWKGPAFGRRPTHSFLRCTTASSFPYHEDALACEHPRHRCMDGEKQKHPEIGGVFVWAGMSMPYKVIRDVHQPIVRFGKFTSASCYVSSLPLASCDGCAGTGGSERRRRRFCQITISHVLLERYVPN